MSEFGPESQALFGAARAGLEPMPANRARVGRALEARLGLAIVTASATVGATAGAAGAGAAMGGASTAAVVAKWVGIGLLLGVGGASSYAVVSRTAAHPSAARPATSLPSAPGPASSSEAPRVNAQGSAAVAPPVVVPAAARAPAPDEAREKPVATAAAVSEPPSAHVGAEAALLRRADEALRAGDADRALVLLREHSLRFPAGILAEERSAELVTTLCRLGRTGEARREAEQFLRATPDSPLAASVRSSCGGQVGATLR